jgi:hypothetical protein
VTPSCIAPVAIVSNFTVQRIATSPRLEGDFRIVAEGGASQPSPAVSHYIATLGDIIAQLALAAVGAAIGAWLSFAARKVTLSFRELAIIEDDFVRPGARIAIVIVLSAIVVLMLGLKLFSVKLGEFDTNSLNPDSALLIGFLCGLSERALASNVVAQATTFIGGMRRTS